MKKNSEWYIIHQNGVQHLHVTFPYFLHPDREGYAHNGGSREIPKRGFQFLKKTNKQTNKQTNKTKNKTHTHHTQNKNIGPFRILGNITGWLYGENPKLWRSDPYFKGKKNLLK